MKRILIVVNKRGEWPSLGVAMAPNGLDYFMSL